MCSVRKAVSVMRKTQQRTRKWRKRPAEGGGEGTAQATASRVQRPELRCHLGGSGTAPEKLPFGQSEGSEGGTGRGREGIRPDPTADAGGRAQPLCASPTRPWRGRSLPVASQTRFRGFVSSPHQKTLKASSSITLFQRGKMK